MRVLTTCLKKLVHSIMTLMDASAGVARVEDSRFGIWGKRNFHHEATKSTKSTNGGEQRVSRGEAEARR
jgi:hypothetical protein